MPPFETPPVDRPPFDTPPVDRPPFDVPPVDPPLFDPPPIEPPPFGLGGGALGDAGELLSGNSIGAGSSSLGSVSISGVPEPGMSVMLLSGTLALLAYAWRRRRWR
jgi:hypothetical protein